MTTSTAGLVDRALNGDRRSLARLLTRVENETEDAAEALALLYPKTGGAHVIGITGAPGTGKSTLVTELTKAYRARGQTVGIVAVDPTSPFTGGAILGDRIRMRELHSDNGVFIRSMATRGTLGGLARTTRDITRVLDAAGFDIVMIETVGAGQNEIAVVRLAQTTVVVEAPGLGDDVQAIKAGILEIADVLVVNKADRPGATNTAAALRAMLELGHPTSRTLRHHGQQMTVETPKDAHAPMWIPPIVMTTAAEAKGIEDLIAQLDAHRAFLQTDGVLRDLERQHIAIELLDRLRDTLTARTLRALPEGTFGAMIDKVNERAIDPQSAVNALLDSVK